MNNFLSARAELHLDDDAGSELLKRNKRPGALLHGNAKRKAKEQTTPDDNDEHTSPSRQPEGECGEWVGFEDEREMIWCKPNRNAAP